MRKTVLVAIACLGMAALSCSDDTTVKPDKTVTKPPDGPVTTGDKGPSPDGKKATEGGGGGACTNSADAALLDTSAKRDAVSGKAKDCGLGCIATPTEKCVSDCLTPKAGLTGGCTTCYAKIVICSINNCLLACSGSDTAGCTKCQQGDNPNKVNCLGQFYTCSGLTP